MLIDIEQHKNGVAVSYVNKDGQIGTKNFNVAEYTDNFGFYDHEICDKSDPDVLPDMTHYDGRPIKKTHKFRFDVEELREFLNVKIPESDREELHAFRSMNAFAVDIEINLSGQEDEIFPDPEVAEYPICTIQITAPNFDTITLTTDKDRIAPSTDDPIIEDMINDYFKDHMQYIKTRIVYKTIILENEADLLNFFFKKVREYLHFTIWWNCDGFDIPYINNRSKLLGIDRTVASPTKTMKRDFKGEDWWPRHRLAEDYMKVVGDYSFDIWPKLSMSLDWISKYIFKIGKVPYDGTFRDMYMGDYKKFLFYGAVDTVLLQMIHQVKNYMNAIEASAYYCKIPLKDTWKQTKLCHALIWDDLYESNMINAEPFVKKVKTSYEGGWVKVPTHKFVEYPICDDFSALYPRLMISHNMSFESFEGRAKDKAEAIQAIKDGKYVSVDGNIYKNDKDYTIRRVEDKLQTARDVYKHMAHELTQTILVNVEDEMKKRGLELDKTKLF